MTANTKERMCQIRAILVFRDCCFVHFVLDWRDVRLHLRHVRYAHQRCVHAVRERSSFISESCACIQLRPNYPVAPQYLPIAPNTSLHNSRVSIDARAVSLQRSHSPYRVHICIHTCICHLLHCTAVSCHAILSL